MAKYVKPTLDTKFHVDFSWWQSKNQNLKAFLRGHACSACQAIINDAEDQVFDWLSPDTGEVFQIDMLWYIIHTHCKDDPEFLDPRVPLTSAIFRVFLANDNTPLTPKEMQELLGPRKSAQMILKTIGARITYKGIKPVESSG